MPRQDAELFDSFFSKPASVSVGESAAAEASADLDFDAVTTDSLLLTVPKRAARPRSAAAAKRSGGGGGGSGKRSSRNPVKQLAARKDLKETYQVGRNQHIINPHNIFYPCTTVIRFL